MGKTKNPPKIIISFNKKPLKKIYKSSKKYQRKILTALNLVKHQYFKKIKSSTVTKELKEEFENYLISNIGSDSVKKIEDEKKSILDLNALETLKLMEQGTPVIINPILINRSEGIYDKADVIVRSDYLQKIIPDNLDEIISSRLGWSYIPILLTDNNFFVYQCGSIKNTLLIKYQKTRSYMHSSVLSYYQHSVLQAGYIVHKNEEGFKFGSINYDGIDKPIKDNYKLIIRM